MAFNIQEARKAGYNDKDIIEFLSKDNPEFDVKSALSTGYSLEDIAKELVAKESKPTQPQQITTPTQIPQEEQSLIERIKAGASALLKTSTAQPQQPLQQTPAVSAPDTQPLDERTLIDRIINKTKQLGMATGEMAKGLTPNVSRETTPVNIPFIGERNLPIVRPEALKTQKVLDTPVTKATELVTQGIEKVSDIATKNYDTAIKNVIGDDVYKKLDQSVLYHFAKELPKTVATTVIENTLPLLTPTNLVLGGIIGATGKVAMESVPALESLVGLRKVIKTKIPETKYTLKPEQVKKIFNTLEGDKEAAELLNKLPNKNEVIKEILKTNKPIEITLPETVTTQSTVSPTYQKIRDIIGLKKVTPITTTTGEIKVQGKPIETPTTTTPADPLQLAQIAPEERPLIDNIKSKAEALKTQGNATTVVSPVKTEPIIGEVPTIKESPLQVATKNKLFTEDLQNINKELQSKPVPIDEKALIDSIKTKSKTSILKQATTEQLKSIEKKALIQDIKNKEDAKIYFDEYSQTLDEINNREFFPVERAKVRKLSGEMDLANKATFYKDIPIIKMQGRDIFRNSEQVFGKDYPIIKEEILDPFDKSKGEYINFLNKSADELKKEVVDNLGIKKGSKESAYVQKYGEKIVSKEELVKKFGEKKAENIIKADAFFRSKYNEYIDKANKTLADIYPNNPEKQIPKREDYYRHFQEQNAGISRLKDILETSQQIDPMLAGISAITKPTSMWQSFMQKRTGNSTKYDAVGGLLNYLPSVAHTIYIDKNIGKFRELAKELSLATRDSKNINNYINNLHKFANQLAGKTNDLDRIVTEIIPGGRKTLAVVNWINSRVKANTILANASSSLSQIFNVPQGIAEAGLKYSSKGVGDTLSQVFVPSEAMKKSSFLDERYFSSFNKFDEGILNNAKKFSVWMVGALDEVGTKFIWNSIYEKAIAKKIPNPIKYADDITRKMVAGRGIGETPLLHRSKVFQLVAPFQLEVGNLWWTLEDTLKSETTKKEKMSKILLFMTSMYLLNSVSEKIKGQRVGFDPIDSMIDAVNIYKNEDTTKKGLYKSAGRLAGEVLSNVPLGQSAASIYPFTDAQRKEFFGKEDPNRFGSGLISTKALKDPIYKILFPYGGGQAKKTIEGIKAYIAGREADKNGKTKYLIKQDKENLIKSILFGKYSTKEAKEYYDNMYKKKKKSSFSF